MVATSRSIRRTSSAGGTDWAALAPASASTTSTAAERSRLRTTLLRSAHGRHTGGDQVRGELLAHLLADLQRVAEMDAAPDAHHPLLVAHLRDAGELPLQARVDHVRHGERRPSAGAEYGVEHAERDANLDGRLRGIFRVHRRGVQ